MLQRDAPGKEPRRETRIERTVHVVASQRREESRVRPREDCRAREHGVGARGEIGAPDDHHGGAVAAFARVDDLAAHVRRERLAGQRPGDDARMRGELVRDRRAVDERHSELDHRAPQAQSEHRNLFFEIAGEQHDRARPVDVCDLRAGHPEHEVGRQAVPHLRVNVVGADQDLRRHFSHGLAGRCDP